MRSQQLQCTVYSTSTYFYIIEGPLGRAHRRPSIYARHTVAGWRNEACNRRSAIAKGQNRGQTGDERGQTGDEIEGRQHFFTKIRSKQTENLKKSFKMHAKSANDAKRSFPREAINRKYTFSQWILQLLRCNRYPQNGNWYFCNGSCKLPRANCRSRMPLFRRTGKANGALFEDLTSKQLAKLCLPPRAGSTFPKNEQN